MPSVSSSSLFHPAASCVRKYTESIVIGSQQQTPAPTPTRQQQPQQQQHADTDIAVVPHEVSSSSPLPHSPRVVVCDFVMKIPTHAIRIEMTILVSTNDRSSRDPRVPPADPQPQPQLSPPPRPSVAYKITICTPARRCRCPQHEHEHHPHRPEGTTPILSTPATMTTVTWSSKFTVAPNVAASSVDPFYEWTGSFDLNKSGTSAAAVPLDACSFYHVEGKFLAHYAEDNTTTATVVPVPVADDVISRNRSSTSRLSRTDTVGYGGDDEASRVPSRKNPRRGFETNHNSNDEAFLPPQTPQQQSPPPLLAGM